MAISRKDGVANRAFPKPTKDNMSLMGDSAKDNPDSLTPESPYKQALGGSGKPQGPFGKMGREC